MLSYLVIPFLFLVGFHMVTSVVIFVQYILANRYKSPKYHQNLDKSTKYHQNLDKPTTSKPPKK